jgi:hypothetical protein
MATVNNIQDAIVALIAATKPDDISVIYHPGKPFPEDLETCMANSVTDVSVFPLPTGRRIKKFLNNEPKIVSLTDDDAVVQTEVARKIRWFQIEVFSNNFEDRDTVGFAIELALEQTNFLSFSDFSEGRIQSVSETEDDSQQKEDVYRRVYVYSVEYAVVKNETVPRACQPQILNVDLEVVAVGTENSVLVDDIT